MKVSDLGVRLKKHSRYGGFYFGAKTVARTSAKVGKINDKLRDVARSCAGTKGWSGKKTNFQICVADKMRGTKA